MNDLNNKCIVVNECCVINQSKVLKLFDGDSCKTNLK